MFTVNLHTLLGGSLVSYSNNHVFCYRICFIMGIEGSASQQGEYHSNSSHSFNFLNKVFYYLHYKCRGHS